MTCSKSFTTFQIFRALLSDILLSIIKTLSSFICLGHSGIDSVSDLYISYTTSDTTASDTVRSTVAKF